MYEYKCGACGYALEAVQKFSDPPLTECPNCGEPALQKLISQSSFALKGGGWYADGYGPKGPGKTEAAGPSADAQKSDTAKSDSKASESSSSADSKPPKSDAKAKASNE